jgi:hypothetical protein
MIAFPEEIPEEDAWEFPNGSSIHWAKGDEDWTGKTYSLGSENFNLVPQDDMEYEIVDGKMFFGSIGDTVPRNLVYSGWGTQWNARDMKIAEMITILQKEWDKI